MFKIGEFSKLANVSIRMLRHYDKLDLLVPQVVDNSSDYRYYSADQLQIINKISLLKEMGFSLLMIKEMLKLNTDIITLEHYFSIREAELKDELDKIARQSSLLENASRVLQEEIHKMNYHTALKTIPARIVVSTRKIINTFHDEGILWQLLYQEIGHQHVKVANEPYAISIFHDEEYKESDVDVEVQVAVEGNYRDTDDVKFKTMPKIEVASVTFAGSYEQMTKVTEVAAQWIEDNHFQLSGSMFNIYHVSPAQDPNPENWITEACFPIRKTTQ